MDLKSSEILCLRQADLETLSLNVWITATRILAPSFDVEVRHNLASSSSFTIEATSQRKNS
jgi:hypothetical protein